MNKLGNKLDNNNYIIFSANFGSAMNDLCPTIPTTGKFYMTKYKRYLTIDELLKLQGFRELKWEGVVPQTEIRKQIGNTMSVCVLKEILKQVFIQK